MLYAQVLPSPTTGTFPTHVLNSNNNIKEEAKNYSDFSFHNQKTSTMFQTSNTTVSMMKNQLQFSSFIQILTFFISGFRHSNRRGIFKKSTSSISSSSSRGFPLRSRRYRATSDKNRGITSLSLSRSENRGSHRTTATTGESTARNK